MLGHTRCGTLYSVDSPGYVKGEHGRANIETLLIPAHEAPDEAVNRNATYRTRLRETIEERRFPPCYYANPLVQAHGLGGGGGGDIVFGAWALFIDGVPYAVGDSMLGLWASDG